MIVRCLRSRIAELSPSDQERVAKNVHLDEVALRIGSEYLVLGVGWRDGLPWFLVLEEDSDTYPHPHFSGLFEVVDPRVPPDWSLRTEPGNVGDCGLLPAAWAADASFMEKLVDDDPEAQALLATIRADVVRWHKR